jgi:hypothetical protein
MHIYCTYCSREKDSAPGNLSATQRYRCARIASIAERARSAG